MRFCPNVHFDEKDARVDNLLLFKREDLSVEFSVYLTDEGF